MLSREVCKKCVPFWTYYDRVRWKDGKVMCIGIPETESLRDIDQPPPQNCRKKFEQAIAAGMEKPDAV
jgi:hypothetical protein